MNRPPDFAACAHTDAVLASALDGVEGTSELGPGELRTHATGCERCRRALTRARRLDAVLAQAAGQGSQLPAALADRFDTALQQLAAAVPVGTGAAAATAARATGSPLPPESPPTHAGRPPWPATRWAAAIAAVAVAAWWLFANPQRPTGRHADAAKPVAAHAPTGPWPPTGPWLQTVATAAVASPPGAALPWWPRREPAVTTAAPTAGPDFASHCATLVTAAPAAAEWASAWSRVAQATRGSHRAGQAAMSTWMAALAGAEVGPEVPPQWHRELLAHCRATPHLVHAVQQRLQQLAAGVPPAAADEPNTLVVAARLGVDELDRGLRRLWRRTPDVAFVVAAALRCEVRDDGGAPLLLAAFGDLAVLGQDDNDARDGEVRLARRLFAGQPVACFAAIAAELRTCRHAERRHRALLALGCATDDHTADLLRHYLASSNLEVAGSAATALLMLPPTSRDRTLQASSAAAERLRMLLARASVVTPPSGDAASLPHRVTE